MDRRFFIGLLGMLFLTLVSPSFAKDGDSGGSNSGSGSNNSGNDGSEGRNDDGDDRDNDDDDDQDDDDDRRDASAAVARGEISAVSKVIRIALQRTPGRVTNVRLKRENNTYVYRIKILTSNGRKRDVHVDARTQRILKVK